MDNLLSLVEKHLNFDVSGSDDGISTDAESLCSYDSGPMSQRGHHDILSISSSDYDSAICSPKSLTLERELDELLTLENLDLGEEASSCSKDNSLLESQASTDTIVCQSDSDGDEDELEERRDRSSTLLAS